MSNPPFKVGDKVRHKNGDVEFLVSDVCGGGNIIFLENSYQGQKILQGWFISDNYVLVEQPKHYFVNDNRTLMTKDEAMKYLRHLGGGTLYKKVLSMSFQTKTEEVIEEFE
jgi:hypothetical protein